MRDTIAPDKDIIFNRKKRAGDIYKMVGNNNLAKVLLEWEPEIDINKGIDEYCQYVIENKEKFKKGNTVGEEQKNIEEKGLVE